MSVGAGFLSDVLRLRNEIPQPTHAACGCRPAISMCGTYTATEQKVQAMDLPQGDEVQQWCQPCLNVWMEVGCGNCPCGPYGLCDICEATLPPATD